MSEPPARKRASKSAAPKRSFGESTQRLEEIIELMDDPQTSLESMILMVEEGLKLIRESRSILADAELRIKKLDSIPTKVEEAMPVEEFTNNNEFTLI